MVYQEDATHYLGYRTVNCPACGQARQMKHLERICGLSDDMRTWTFDNTRRTSGNQHAYDAALDRSSSPRWFLTLMGSYGVGKTRLLACIVNSGREAGMTSVYTTTAELLDHLRRAYAPNAPISYDDLLDKVESCTILALDELDRFNPTPWALEKFFELIDTRYRAGTQRLTAFATNVDLDSDALPGYLVSRMRDRRSMICTIRNSDQRQGK